MDKAQLLIARIIMKKKLSSRDVLSRYISECLPEFYKIKLDNVNQPGVFGNYPLNIACVRGDIDEVLALISGGANIDASGELGYTPLHDAVARENVFIVKILLKSGASKDKKNDFGMKAIDIASRDKNEAIINILK